MGHWALHITGHGVHDNGREDDADSMAREFAGKLADAGHDVHSVSFTSGSSKELLNADDSTPLHAGIDEPGGGRALRWRHRA